MRAALLLLAACASSSPPPTVANHGGTGPPEIFEVSMKRTMCFGQCPVYTVTIHGDGSVVFLGEIFVKTTHPQKATLRPGDLATLREALDRSRFFDHDKNGRLPKDPTCLRSGNSMTCDFEDDVICSDTSHSVITVKRGTETHEIDHDHCTASLLDALETTIDELAGTRVWIGS